MRRDQLYIVEAQGYISIDGNEMTWEEDSYCNSRNLGNATYAWTITDDTFLLRLIGEDRCIDRLEVLAGIPYHKESVTVIAGAMRQYAISFTLTSLSLTGRRTSIYNEVDRDQLTSFLMDDDTLESPT